MEENKMEEVKKEEAKKSSGVWIVVALVVVLIIGIGIGVLVPPMLQKKDTNTPNTEEKDAKEEVKDTIVEVSEDEITAYKKVIHYANTFYIPALLESEKVSNQDLLYGAWMIAKEEGKADTESDISKEQMKEYVSYIFGNDYSYQDENIQCGCSEGDLYRFDGTTYHRYGTHGHGGKSVNHSQEYFVAANRNETKNELVIQMKVLYGPTCSVCGPSSEYYQTPGGEVLYKTDDPEHTSYDDVYEKIKDQIPVTTYTFKKDSKGGYGLSSVKIGE